MLCDTVLCNSECFSPVVYLSKAMVTVLSVKDVLLYRLLDTQTSHNKGYQLPLLLRQHFSYNE
jgi:hypothetical protein